MQVDYFFWTLWEQLIFVSCVGVGGLTLTPPDAKIPLNWTEMNWAKLQLKEFTFPRSIWIKLNWVKFFWNLICDKSKQLIQAINFLKVLRPKSADQNWLESQSIVGEKELNFAFFSLVLLLNSIHHNYVQCTVAQ